ncbi:MAG: hypothetical protein HC783_13785 [Rhodobacteraceae bacterium]|nr:hypothetical protein [Paracoccaceae bacterium]
MVVDPLPEQHLRELRVVFGRRHEPAAPREVHLALHPIRVGVPLRPSDGIEQVRRHQSRLERRIRAFDPWPGTFVSWSGQALRVLAAETIRSCLDLGDAFFTLVAGDQSRASPNLANSSRRGCTGGPGPAAGVFRCGAGRRWSARAG